MDKQALINDIKDYRLKGFNYKAISVKCGITYQNAYLLGRNNGAVGGTARKLNPVQLDEIRVLMLTGMKKSTICAQYGVCYPTLRRLIFGVP